MPRAKINNPVLGLRGLARMNRMKEAIIDCLKDGSEKTFHRIGKEINIPALNEIVRADSTSGKAVQELLKSGLINICNKGNRQYLSLKGAMPKNEEPKALTPIIVERRREGSANNEERMRRVLAELGSICTDEAQRKADLQNVQLRTEYAILQTENATLKKQIYQLEKELAEAKKQQVLDNIFTQ